MLHTLRSAIDRIEIVLGWSIAALVVFLEAIVLSQFVDRHFFDVGIDAPDQIARVGIVWLTFLGFALAVRDGSAIRVDLFDHIMPGFVRALTGFCFDVATLALSVVIAYHGWRVVEVGAGQLILGTPFTAALPNTGLFIGAVLTAIFVALRLILRLISQPGEAR